MQRLPDFRRKESLLLRTVGYPNPINSQIYEVQNATSQPLGFAAQYTVTFIAALGLAFYTAWNLTLVTIAAAPFISLILACLSARMQRNIDSQTVYLIIAIDTVKTFNGQDHEVRQYIEALKRAALSYLKVAQGNALQIGIIRATVLGMFVQGFWYGTYLVAVGDKTAGQVLTAFWGCLMAIQIIEQLSPQMIVLEKGKLASASLKTILGKVEGCRKVTKMFGGKVPRFCDGEIQITKVSSTRILLWINF
jgi:ATP-binding cassette subfamily B (MDR/TAP) protein 1